MKVILIKDVGGVGKKDTVKEFSDGYAMNFLIAKGLAVQASPQKIAEIEARQKAEAAASAQREKEWDALADKLSATTISVKARANEADHLYTQLAPTVIVAAIREQMKLVVPTEALQIKKPIKELGDHEITIKYGTKTAKVKIAVTKEQK